MDKKELSVPKDGLMKEVSYHVDGIEVKLSASAVKNYLTKGNKELTDSEIVMFMSLCKFSGLNPYLNDAYLIKYGANAQMVTSKEAFIKRAESNEDYRGFTAGVILLREGVIVYEEGGFKLPKDTLVGGWCRVSREGKKDSYVSVSMDEYDKKESIWLQKPATMIRKVAIAQALREAYPKLFGSMYTDDEIKVTDTTYTEIKDEQKAVVEIPHKQNSNPFKGMKSEPETVFSDENANDSSNDGIGTKASLKADF